MESPLQQLPPYVADRLKSVEVASFLGLFPEIYRSYLTYDNELFIWNYENPADQLWYRELCQPIRAVGLVVPKSDVFEEFVKVRVCVPMYGSVWHVMQRPHFLHSRCAGFLLHCVFLCVCVCSTWSWLQHPRRSWYLR